MRLKNFKHIICQFFILLHTLSVPQMKMEFEFIVGEGSVQRMKRNWERWSRMMLGMSDNSQLTELKQWEAVQELDKHVRSPGVCAKATPIF